MAKQSKKKTHPEALFPKLKPSDGVRIFKVLLIVAVGFWIYYPALHGAWLWDDDYLIEQNDLVHSPNGWWFAWFTPSNLIDYTPLTASVMWLEWQLWPNDTFCYHLTNVILNACSALLVWHLFAKLGLRLAWLGGLLFTVHPVMVESVAWMAELKNTLSMPFFLLAACVWIDYDQTKKAKYYFLAMGFFLTAMLCKTSMVMFPVIILLYAWWKRNRIAWNDLKSSIPFFAFSLAVTMAVIAYRRHGVGEETIPLDGFLSRLACAGTSLAFYFSKCFLPIGLSATYPQWKVDPPALWQALPWLAFGGALYWLWTKRRGWGRHALFGFGFFLINLLPFVGFYAISFMRFGWVADHLLYIPILGLLGLAVAAVGQMEERLDASVRLSVIGVIAVVAAVLAFQSHRYATVYLNSETLWAHTIQTYPDAWLAHNNLGLALENEGRLSEATEQYEAAVRLNPGYPEAHNNLGTVLVRMGRIPEAIDEFKLALKYGPDVLVVQENLAQTQAAQASHSK